MNHGLRAHVSLASGVVLGLFAGHAFGAAFALQENSGSAMGNAFAGGAAAAEDASTLWSNPAGMTRLTSPQLAAAVHFVTPSFNFHDEGSQPAAFQPLGGTGGDAGSLNVIPNLYVVVPLNPQWSFGVGVNAPFGLVTEYDNNWLGRFQAVKSDIKTINVNPSAAWRVNDAFSVGLGVSWQRVDAELTSRINYSAGLAQGAAQAAAGGLIPPALAPQIVALTPGLEANAKVKGDDSTWGWNIGFLWDVTPQTRIGGQYRSSVKYTVSGTASFDYPALPAAPAPIVPVLQLLAGGVNSAICGGPGVNAPGCTSTGFSADIKLPDIANLSIFHRLNNQWDVMADLQFTRWSTFRELEFVRSNGRVLQNTPENFDDVWRFSVGATYHWNDAWSFRGGLAYDQSPVNTTDRTPRLPDSDRVWIAIGAQYRLNPNFTVDAGYVYIPMRDADINQNAGSTAANGLVKGHYESNVNIFSLQLTYTF